MPDKDPLHVRAHARFKVSAGPSYAAAALFFVMLLFCVSGTLVFWPLSAVLVLLLGMPCYFAVFHLVIGYSQGEPPSARTTLRLCAAYYSPRFRGCYRSLINALKGLGFGVGTSALFLLVYFSVGVASVDGVAAEMDAILREYLSYSLEAMINVASSSSYFVRGAELSTTIGLGVGVTVYFGFITDYAMNPLILFAAEGLTPRLARPFYNRYFAHSRRDYYRMMLVHGYGSPFALPVGYAIGASLGYAFGLPSNVSNTIALAGGFLLVCLYLPYVSLLQQEFFGENRRNLILAQLDVTEAWLNQLRSIHGPGHPDVESLEKDLEATKQRLRDFDAQQSEK